MAHHPARRGAACALADRSDEHVDGRRTSTHSCAPCSAPACSIAISARAGAVSLHARARPVGEVVDKCGGVSTEYPNIRNPFDLHQCGGQVRARALDPRRSRLWRARRSSTCVSRPPQGTSHWTVDTVLPRKYTRDAIGPPQYGAGGNPAITDASFKGLPTISRVSTFSWKPGSLGSGLVSDHLYGHLPPDGVGAPLL